MRRGELQTISVEKIKRGRYQPRKQFLPEQLEELAQSIKMNGLVQPIVVRPIADDKYEIVAGERRWRAVQMAGLSEIDCLLHHYSDEQAAEITTIENINRVDLNPIEEAEAYQRLIDEFSYTHEEIAAVTGKSRVKISNCLRLLKLAPAVREYLIDGKLSEGHGKILAAYPSAQQIKLAEKAISLAWSVRKLEREAKRDIADANSSQDDPNLKKLVETLGEHLGCPVDIECSSNKGRLSIDFHNLDILHGLFEKMGFKYE